MKQSKLAYLAGILDGEDSVRIEFEKREHRGRENNYRLRLSISNTDLNLMNWLTTNFGRSCLKEKKRIGNYKQYYQWEIKSNTRSASLLKQLLPYLIIKRERAEVAIEFAKMMKGTGNRYTEQEKQQRKELYEKMKQLNKKGFL